MSKQLRAKFISTLAEARYNWLMPWRWRPHTHEEYARFKQTFVIGEFRWIQSECLVSRTHSELSGGDHRFAYHVERTFWHWRCRLHGSRFDHYFESVRLHEFLFSIRNRITIFSFSLDNSQIGRTADGYCGNGRRKPNWILGSRCHRLCQSHCDHFI